MGFSFRVGLTADDWRAALDRAAQGAVLWVDQAYLDRLRGRLQLAADRTDADQTVWLVVEPYILPLISEALPDQVQFQAIRVVPKEGT